MTEMSDKKLSDSFGLEYYDPEEDKSTPTISVNTSISTDVENYVPTEMDEDDKEIEEVKENIREMINLGKMSIQEIAQIASSTENPRAFEVLSTLMKTLLDANKELSDHVYKKKDEKIYKEPEKVTNNNLILTTADLLNLLQEK